MLRATVLLYAHTSLKGRPIAARLKGADGFRFVTFQAAWARWFKRPGEWS